MYLNKYSSLNLSKTTINFRQKLFTQEAITIEPNMS